MDGLFNEFEVERIKTSLKTKSTIKNLVNFSQEEIENSIIIYNDINTIGNAYLSESPTISLFTLLDETIDYFNLFEPRESNEISKYIYQLLKNINITQSDSVEDNMFIFFNAIKANTGWIRIPTEIIIPDKLTKEAPAHLAHELSHVLKELNSNEFKYINVMQDVIPLLIELIIALEHEDLKVKLNIVNKIQSDFYATALRTKELQGSLGDTKNPFIQIYIKEAIQINYQYFNSLYYSLALLDLYLENPRIVLNSVKNVLLRQKTTRELIDELLPSRDIKMGHYKDGISEYNSFIVKGQ